MRGERGSPASLPRPFGVSHDNDHETKHRSRTNNERSAYAMEGRPREIPRLPPVLWLSLNANDADEGRCQGWPTGPLRHLRTGRSGGSERLVRDNRTADCGSATKTRSGVGCPLRRRLREPMARRKRQERCVRMARKMTEWPSKRGPISKISPSDGCGRDAVLLAVERWYDFPEFGGYLANVGLTRHGTLLILSWVAILSALCSASYFRLVYLRRANGYPYSGFGSDKARNNG